MAFDTIEYERGRVLGGNAVVVRRAVVVVVVVFVEFVIRVVVVVVVKKIVGATTNSTATAIITTKCNLFLERRRGFLGATAQRDCGSRRHLADHSRRGTLGGARRCLDFTVEARYFYLKECIREGTMRRAVQCLGVFWGKEGCSQGPCLDSTGTPKLPAMPLITVSPELRLFISRGCGGLYP